MSITDQIRKQLEQPDALTLEAIEPLAEAYGQESMQANARLAECTQLLRKGLRSEAIQRAAMKPNLLDWCARLDFPEIDDWLEILKFYGITVPPLLDRDSAQQLQEAIVDEQPLEELLRQHRRLAIGKAPLAWRLKVLRRLAQLDSVNAVWRDDQQQWEIARLKQIPAELNRAIEAGSLTEVQAIAAELNRSEWVAAPPKGLCKQAAAAAGQLLYRQQVARLQRLTDSLHAAYSAGDEAAAEKHYRAWNMHVSEMVSPPPPELTQSAEPAIEWLSECSAARDKVQQFELHSATLENMLQNNANLADLERGYYNVASLQLGIDPILEQRYEARVAALKQSAGRKTQLIFFSISTAAVTLLVLFGLWQWNRAHRLAVGQAVARLEELIDAEDFDTAEGVVKQLTADDSAVAKAPEVIALVESLKSKHTAEISRAERVAGMIDEAAEDDPAEIDINKVILAEKEAKTADEKLRIKRLRAALETYDRSVAEMQSEAVKKAVTNFDARLLTIEQLPLEEISDSELDSIVIDLNKLTIDYPKSTNASALVQPAVKRARSIKDGVQKQRDEIAQRQRSMRGLRTAATLSAFTSEMKEYADRLPGDPLAKQFSETLSEQGLWQSVEKWNQWCAATTTAVQGGLSADELRDAAGQLKSVNEALSNTPGASLEKDLTAAMDACDARISLLATLKESFDSNEGLGALVTLIDPTKDEPQVGKRRFIHHTNRAQNALALSKLSEYSKTLLPVVVNESFQNEEAEFRGKLFVLEEPRATVRQLNTLFQSERFVEDWENQMIEAMRMLVVDKNLDWQLKEFFLEAVVKAAREGSIFMAQPLEPVEVLLRQTQDKRAFWYLPNDFRERLSPELLEALRVAVQQIKASRDAFDKKVQTAAQLRFTWIGATLRDSSDKVEAWLTKSNSSDGQLWTLLPAGDSKTVGRLVNVGTVRNNKGNLKALPDALLPGRPLYWSPDLSPITTTSKR